ncbi:MAG: hypothetical protein JO015_01120 [Verrucomicrobia bacterium]|nr:hypothetical protein [Verrucomicrobiota bacterium]
MLSTAFNAAFPNPSGRAKTLRTLRSTLLPLGPLCAAALIGLAGVNPAAASTSVWKAGTNGSYTAGANWVGGVAPGPGDTALITGSSPWFTDSEATNGDTIAQQALDFEAGPGSPIVGILGQTTFAADTILNCAGGGLDQQGTWLKAYHNNALNGTINVGSASATARLTLNVLDDGWNLYYTPTTQNNGTITIAGGSVLHIYPSAGGYTLVYQPGGPPVPVLLSGDPGWADFTNNGLITVTPGGTLVHSWETAGSGRYQSALINNGVIRVQGAEGQRTRVEVDANLSGTGTIVLDGGDAVQPSETTLSFSGNLRGQDIQACNAGVEVVSPLDEAQLTGGRITFFGQGRSYLLVFPASGVDQPGDPSTVLPFGLPIKGFRAGDVIAFMRAYPYGTETYTPVWDQANQQLTIWVTNSLHPERSARLAVFTLEGTYGPDDFQVSYSDGTSGRTAQVDLITTNQSPREP